MSDLKSSALKPVDVAIALKILLLEERSVIEQQADQTSNLDVPDVKVALNTWSLRQLAKETHVSLGEVHNSVRRLQQSQLISRHDRRVRRKALYEFLIHGVRYAYPATYGPPTRGIATAYAAPVLKDNFILPGQETPVWPYFVGTIRGISFSPLYAAAPAAALEDTKFYDLLALTDALRGDARVRERTAATELLHRRILGDA